MDGTPNYLTVLDQMHLALADIEKVITPTADVNPYALNTQAAYPFWVNYFTTTVVTRPYTSLVEYTETVRAVCVAGKVTQGIGDEVERLAQSIKAKAVYELARRPSLACVTYPAGVDGLTTVDSIPTTAELQVSGTEGNQMFNVVVTLTYVIQINQDPYLYQE